ncbi:MAG: enoyl-CoA hydratase/isomerase family protein [Gemmatimonadota bacterium]
MSAALDFDSPLYSCHQVGRLAVFRFERSVLDIGTDLALKDKELELFRSAEVSPDTDAILFLNSRQAFGEGEYDRFLHRLFSPAESGDSFERDRLVHREEIAINQLITAIDGCPKATFIGLQGHVAGPFVGISLAFDYRLAASDMVYSVACVRTGIPPGGGLGFFLPMHLGIGRTKEIVFRGDDIPAAEARDLGLVNAVLPVESFEEQCIARAQQIAARAGRIGHTKRLLHPYSPEELAAYLEREYAVMRQVWMHPER